jgi:hypothetical protein
MQALKILVIVMGVLIVIGTIIVVATIANRVSRLGQDAPAAPIAADVPETAAPGPLASFGDVSVALPDGCRVVEMTPAGERLLLRLGSIARCNRILVVDLGTGRLLGSIELAAPAPQ